MADASKVVGGTVGGATSGAAVGGPYGAIAGGAIGLITSLMGGDQGAAGEANNARNIANQIIQNIQNAPDESKPVLLEQYRQAGLLTPQMEQAVQLGQSQLSQIGTDQTSLAAQRAALEQLSQRSKSGLTAVDRAALNQSRTQNQADTEAKRQQILQEYRAKTGGVGSMQGLELASQLQAAQGGANAQSAEADRIMAQSQNAALQAAVQSGQMGGQINEQQFNQAAAKAQAADQFNRFNVSAQQAAQKANVGAQNQAQQYNLNQAQNIANANVTGANQEAYGQIQRQQDEWQKNANLAGMKAGAYTGQANYLQNLSNQRNQGSSNMGAGVGGIASNLAGILSSSSGSSGSPDVGYGAGVTKAMHEGTDPAMYGGMSQGGQVHDYRDGGQVPGEAKHPGDHPANDTVHAMLSPGEIVLPRTIAKTSIGKRLAKLLEDHHQLRKDIGE